MSCGKSPWRGCSPYFPSPTGRCRPRCRHSSAAFNTNSDWGISHPGNGVGEGFLISAAAQALMVGKDQKHLEFGTVEMRKMLEDCQRDPDSSRPRCGCPAVGIGTGVHDIIIGLCGTALWELGNRLLCSRPC
jgi:hypothetical protein